MTELVKIEIKNEIAHVILNRPEVKNVFNAELIAQLTGAFKNVATKDARVIILSGEGNIFCAGADVNWMKNSISYTEKENYEDAMKMATMFEAIDTCPLPVIAKVQGGAYGGGVGLISACDITVAESDAKFTFSEVALGIIPAVISPYVRRKIGEANARRFFLTAELFGAETAKRIGLVHEVTEKANTETAIAGLVKRFFTVGPKAVIEAKKLIRALRTVKEDGVKEFTAKTISRIRTTPEAQEGLKAFIEKRKPTYNKS